MVELDIDITYFHQTLSVKLLASFSIVVQPLDMCFS